MLHFIMKYTDFYLAEPVRVLFAFFLSMALVILCGNKFINLLRRKQGKGQPIREDGPQSHLLTKKGTPTMGGIMIVGSIIINCLLWTNLSNIFVITSLIVLIVYAFVGFCDDYEKVTKQTANAMTPRMKLIIQFSAALISVLVITWASPEEVKYAVKIPFLNDGAGAFFLNLSWFYIPFAMVVITGSSNAVNLTDGLDGLASGLLAIAFIAFAILCFNFYDTQMAIICMSVAGSCIGFLWYNAYPARVFMGDTGSLSLGALLGTISVITKNELFLAIIGFIFVVEAISVMMQIFWFKKTGKRIFRMAPIHHHFEQIGMHETTVMMRFWIIGFILAVIGIGAQ